MLVKGIAELIFESVYEDPRLQQPKTKSDISTKKRNF